MPAGPAGSGSPSPAGGRGAHFAPGIRELADRAAADGPVLVIAIDIPIGLADTGRRVRTAGPGGAQGGRWPSLFITPVRAAVEADGYQAAAAENRRLAGEGLSRQAFALRAKILDVDQWLRAVQPRAGPGGGSPPRAELRGRWWKPTGAELCRWPGHAKPPGPGRSSAGPCSPRRASSWTATSGLAGEQAGVNDVLDAAAAAWTARRVSQGSARCLPQRARGFQSTGSPQLSGPDLGTGQPRSRVRGGADAAMAAGATA